MSPGTEMGAHLGSPPPLFPWASRIFMFVRRSKVYGSEALLLFHEFSCLYAKAPHMLTQVSCGRHQYSRTRARAVLGAGCPLTPLGPRHQAYPSFTLHSPRFPRSPRSPPPCWSSGVPKLPLGLMGEKISGRYMQLLRRGNRKMGDGRWEMGDSRPGREYLDQVRPFTRSPL